MNQVARTQCPQVLFPLPLTALEHYYWCDNHHEYPTTFPFKLLFNGKLQRGSLETAWTKALERHPMLQAGIDVSKGWPIWVETAGPFPELQWSESASAELPGDAAWIDLTCGNGVRGWVHVDESTSQIHLQFHHACCDGLGAQQFIRDLLLYYESEVKTSATAIKLLPFDPDRLVARGDFRELLGDVKPTWGVQLRRTRVVITEWIKLLLRKPAPLGLPRGRDVDRAPQQTQVDFVTGFLGENTQKQLRQAATKCAVQLNDILMRDLFFVVRDWNRQYGGRRREWLRINMPVSLRVAEDRKLSAATRMSFSFISRRANQCDDAGALLMSIHREIARIKDRHLSLCFTGGLQAAGNIKGLIPRFLRQKRSFATIVLSNLGRVLPKTDLPRRNGRIVCGDVELEQYLCVPPIRPFTRAAIAVSVYAERLNFHIQCDPRYYTKEEATEFLNRYLKQLTDTAAQVDRPA